MKKTESEMYWMALGEIAALIIGILVAALVYTQAAIPSTGLSVLASIVCFAVSFKVINGVNHLGYTPGTEKDQEAQS